MTHKPSTSVTKALDGVPVGFVGLGVMGLPMAKNLLRAGARVIAWNRSQPHLDEIAAHGAEVAPSVEAAFAATDTIICMLANEAALDVALGRGTASFAPRVSGRLIISMGSNLPEYSRILATEIADAGGRYLEAPVSGSRIPAEEGQLVVLLGGAEEDLTAASPLFQPLSCRQIPCGGVGAALEMKLALNLMLNTMLAGMAEAVQFADTLGLDLDAFSAAIASGPMDCAYSRTKLPKLIAQDYSVQATMRDAFNSTQLIDATARRAAICTPMLETALALYGEGAAKGFAEMDMAAVREAIALRSRLRSREPSGDQPKV